MKLNRSVKRSIEILELLSKTKDGLSLAEIQNTLEIPKSSAFDLIQTLLITNMISPSEYDNKKYIIGINSFVIGTAYESDLVSISRKYLKELAEELGKTVFLGIEKDGEVIYLNKAEPERSIFTVATLGSKNPIHCTSLGKAIMAHRSADTVERYLDEMGMEQFTEFTITNKLDYFKELNKVLKNGYAVDDREIEEKMLCIGAPIFNNRGKVVAAISASGFFEGHENVEEDGKKIRSTANLISQKLGFN